MPYQTRGAAPAPQARQGISGGCRAIAAAILALSAIASSPPGAAADEGLPIFDTHVHYSQAAWQTFDPATVIAMMDAANVPRALVSSTPDDGTLRLYGEYADRFVPILRPYHGDLTAGNWFRDPRVGDYLAARLRHGIYRGLGEFHLFDEGAVATPAVRRVIALAVARDIVLHVHSGSGPVRALFDIEPRLKILWAHAGMIEPAPVVGELLDRYPRLWTELSFRAADIAPDGRLDPAWRELFLRHPERFMIGTDTYINARWAVYPELLEEHRRWLAQLPREVAAAIAHRNAAREFGAWRHGN
jgi:hypothetical protein